MSTMGTYKYRVEFEPDTTKFQSAVSNLQNTLSTIARTPIAFDSSGLVAAKNEAQQLSQILKQATNVNTGKLDISKFSQQLKASGKDLSQYAASLQKLGANGQQAFMQLAQSIGQAHVPIRTTNRLLQSLGANLLNVAKWQISSTILTGFTSAISSAVQYSKDLNKNLNDIRIVSGESAGAMDAFAEKANKAAKALSTTTNEYAKASLIFYQQGLNAKEVEERAEATIKMANVTGESADSVSSYMTAIWNNFDNGSKSLEYYADVMAALGAATASSTDEIATGLEKFAGIAETVGLSYEYATTALATLVAQTRQSPETVGTALKTIFSRLQGLKLGETLEDGTNLNKYSEALAVVGVNIKDSNGALKDMDQILNDLGQKWNLINRDQQMALAQTVGGIRQYTQLITLMDNWDTFKINLDTAENAEGELNKQAEIYAESWEAASDRAKASLESLYAQLVPEDQLIELTNLFSGFLDSITEVVDNFGGLGPILLMTFGMLASRFLPQIIAGGMTIVSNMRIAAGLGQKQTQDFIQQAQVEMQKAGMLNQQSQLYQQMLSNTQKILELRNYELENAKSLTSERKREIDAQIEALNQENALLMATEKRKKELEQMQSLTMGQGIMYAEQHGHSGSEAKTALTNLRQDTMFSQYLSEWGMDPNSQNQPFGRNVNGDINTAKNFVRGQGQRLEAGFKESYGVSTSEVLGYQKVTAEVNKAQTEINNYKGSKDEVTYKNLQKALKEATAAQKEFSEAARNADDAMVKNAESIQEINGLADKEVTDLNKLEAKYNDLTNDIVANTEEKLKNSRTNTAKIAGTTATENMEKNTREEVSLNAPHTDPTIPKEPTDQELFNQAQKERSDAMKSSVQGVTSALMGASMAIQAIQSLGSIWSNDDLSIGEKWASTIMSVSMALGGLMSTASGVGQVMKGVATWIQKSGEMAQLSAAMTEKADNRQNKSALKRIKFSIGKAWGDATAAAAVGNFGPLMTVIGIGAAIAALIGGGIALTLNASKRQDNKEQAEKDYKKASETIETAKNNQEATKSYNELLKTYEETGEGKEELAKQAEKLAEAYDIEGAALARLTGDYKEFTKKVNEAVQEENDKVIRDSDLALNSIEQVIRDKDFLEKGDGGDGADVFTAGKGKYYEAYNHYVSDDVVSLFKANNLDLFSGSGYKFSISGSDQAEVLWQMIQARELLLTNADDLGEDGKGLLKELEDKLKNVDEEYITQVSELYQAKANANLSNAYLVTDKNYKEAEGYDGAIDTIDEYKEFKNQFLDQAESLGIAKEAAEEYFDSLSEFKDLRDLNTVLTEDYEIVDEDQRRLIEKLYKEYGSLIFEPQVVPFLKDGAEEALQEQLDGLKLWVDVKTKNSKEDLYDQLINNKIDLPQFIEEVGKLEGGSKYKSDGAEYNNLINAIASGNITYLQDQGFEEKTTEHSDTGMIIDNVNTRNEALDEAKKDYIKGILTLQSVIPGALGTKAYTQSELQDYSLFELKNLYDKYNTKFQEIYNSGTLTDIFKVKSAKSYNEGNATSAPVPSKEQIFAETPSKDVDISEAQSFLLGLGYPFATVMSLGTIEQVVQWYDEEAQKEGTRLNQFYKVAGLTYNPSQYKTTPNQDKDVWQFQANSIMGGSWKTIKESGGEIIFPTTTPAGEKKDLVSSAYDNTSVSSLIEQEKTSTVILKDYKNNDIKIQGSEYQNMISAINSANSIGDILDIFGTMGIDYTKNDYLKSVVNSKFQQQYKNSPEMYEAFIKYQKDNIKNLKDQEKAYKTLQEAQSKGDKQSIENAQKEYDAAVAQGEQIRKNLKDAEDAYAAENKLIDLRSKTSDYLKTIKDEDAEQWEKDEAYMGIAQQLNLSYGTNLTGEELQADPEKMQLVNQLLTDTSMTLGDIKEILMVLKPPTEEKLTESFNALNEKVQGTEYEMTNVEDTATKVFNAINNFDPNTQGLTDLYESLSKDVGEAAALNGMMLALGDNVPEHLKTYYEIVIGERKVSYEDMTQQEKSEYWNYLLDKGKIDSTILEYDSMGQPEDPDVQNADNITAFYKDKAMQSINDIYKIEVEVINPLKDPSGGDTNTYTAAKQDDPEYALKTFGEQLEAITEMAEENVEAFENLKDTVEEVSSEFKEGNIRQAIIAGEKVIADQNHIIAQGNTIIDSQYSDIKNLTPLEIITRRQNLEKNVESAENTKRTRLDEIAAEHGGVLNTEINEYEFASEEDYKKYQKAVKIATITLDDSIEVAQKNLEDFNTRVSDFESVQGSIDNAEDTIDSTNKEIKSLKITLAKLPYDTLVAEQELTRSANEANFAELSDSFKTFAEKDAEDALLLEELKAIPGAVQSLKDLNDLDDAETQEAIRELETRANEIYVQMVENAQERRDQAIEMINDANDNAEEQLEVLQTLADALTSMIEILDKLPEDLSGAEENTKYDAQQRQVIITGIQYQSTQAFIKELKAQKQSYSDIMSNLEQEGKNNTLEYETYKKAYNETSQLILDKNSELLSLGSTMLDQATEAYLTGVNSSLEKMSQYFSNFGTELMPRTLEDLEKAYERAEELEDQYLDEGTQDYELNKLTRTLNKELSLNNQNLFAQEKLLDVMNEIDEIREKGLKMSEYDLKMLNAKFELRKAEIAFEEAQQNKSQARLVRNAQGNWNYVFTANQNAIDDAAQAVEDAKYNIYKTNYDQIETQESNILKAQKAHEEEIREIYEDTTLTAEERALKIAEADKHLAAQVAFYTGEMGKALSVMDQLYGETGYNFENTTYGMITNYNDLDEVQKRLSQGTGIITEEMSGYYSTWRDKVKRVIDLIIGDNETYAEFLGQQANESQPGSIANSVHEIELQFVSSFTKMNNVIGTMSAALKNLVEVIKTMPDIQKAIMPQTDYAGGILKYYEEYLDAIYNGNEDAAKIILDSALIANENRNTKLKNSGQENLMISNEELMEYFGAAYTDKNTYSPENFKNSKSSGYNTLAKKFNVEYVPPKEPPSPPPSSLPEVDLGNTEETITPQEKPRQENGWIQHMDDLSAQGKYAHYQFTEISNSKIPDTQYGSKEDREKAFEYLINQNTPNYDWFFKEDVAWTLDDFKKYGKFLIPLLIFGTTNGSTNLKGSWLKKLDATDDGIAANNLYAINRKGYGGITTSNNKPLRIGDSKNSITFADLKEVLEKNGIDGSNYTFSGYSFDTGGYTGDWNSSEGRLAMLHEKEIVLNKADTKNLLSAVEVLRSMSSSIAGMILGNAGAQMNGLSKAITTAAISSLPTLLQQEVHIDASFPGVTSAQEIENALNNIINDVAQYAEIKNL